MDWYLDLWTKQPMKASVLMEILLLLIVAGISDLLYSDTLAQEMQRRKRQRKGAG